MSHVAIARPAPRARRSGGADPGGLSHRQILAILSGLMLGLFLAALDQTVVATSIRTISDNLHGLSLQAWATTAYLITGTISTPLYGKLSDLYGRKPFFLASISIFVGGSLACAFATSMYQLAGFRALQGLGAGGLFSLALAIIGDIVPPRERARYQGYFLAVFGTSSVLGPVIGGFLAGQASILGITGWRWVFLVNVPIGVFALFVVARVLNIPHTPREHRIDWPGAIAIAVALVPLLVVAEQGRTWGWGSDRAIACYLVGGVGLVLFLLAERRIGDDALLPLRLFRNDVFSVTSAAAVIIGIGMFGGIAVIPLYLQIVKGASPTRAGLLMVPLVAGIMVASVVSGQVTARTGRYKVLPLVGTLLMAGALLLLHARLGADTPLWEADVYMVMFGLGLGGCMQSLTLAVQNAVPARDMGVATASATFFRQMGGTVGTAVFLSILFSTVTGNIRDAFRAIAPTPQFQAALADPAVRANPANGVVLAATQQGGLGGNASGVLQDSSFIQRLDPRLARPFLVGFSESMDLVFLVGGGVMALGVLLILFLREVPLRTQSGLQARAEELAAETAAGPAPGPMAAEAVEAVQPESAPAAPSPRPLGDGRVPARVLVGAGVGGAGVGGDGVGGDGVGGDGVGGDGVAADREPARAARDLEPDLESDLERDLERDVERDLEPDLGREVERDLEWDVEARNAATGPLGGQHPVPEEAGRAGTGHHAGPVIFGQVTRGGGAPLAAATLTLTDLSGRQLDRATSNGSGHYRLAPPTGGTYLVICASPTHRPRAALVAVADVPVRHDVVLSGGGTSLSGAVRIAGTGQGVGGAVVTLTDVRGDVAAATTTGSDGRFSFADLVEGDYTLTVASTTVAPVAQSVTLPAEGHVDHDVEVMARARLVGTVRSASSGAPVPEALATLVDADGNVVGSTITGSDGGFSFDDLDAGAYTVIATGYPPVAAEVQVGAGEPTETVLTLQPPALAGTDGTVGDMAGAVPGTVPVADEHGLR